MNVNASLNDGYYTRTIMTHSDYRNRVVDKKTVFLPIERNEILKSRLLDQNRDGNHINHKNNTVYYEKNIKYRIASSNFDRITGCNEDEQFEGELYKKSHLSFER